MIRSIWIRVNKNYSDKEFESMIKDVEGVLSDNHGMKLQRTNPLELKDQTVLAHLEEKI